MWLYNFKLCEGWLQALSWLLGRGMVMMTSAGSGWHSDTETRAHWARASCSTGSRGSKYLNIVIELLSTNWAQDFTAFIYSVEDMNDLNVYYTMKSCCHLYLISPWLNVLKQYLKHCIKGSLHLKKWRRKKMQARRCDELISKQFSILNSHTFDCHL